MRITRAVITSLVFDVFERMLRYQKHHHILEVPQEIQFLQRLMHTYLGKSDWIVLMTGSLKKLSFLAAGLKLLRQKDVEARVRASTRLCCWGCYFFLEVRTSVQREQHFSLRVISRYQSTISICTMCGVKYFEEYFSKATCICWVSRRRLSSKRTSVRG